jgi:MFS family permease
MSRPADTVRILRAVGRNHSLRRELTAFLIFNTAEWSAWVAMLVYAYQRGGASAAGLVAVAQLVPAIFVAPLGSVMGDRMPREKALVIGYVVQAAAMGLTAVALRASAPIPVIYLCAAVSNCAITLTRPVHNSLLPELARTPPELTAANSLSSTVEGFSVFIGPVLTGVLLEVSGAWLVFASMSVALGLAVVLTLRLDRYRVFREDAAGAEGVVSSALHGFSELRRDRGAGLLTLLVGAQFVVVGMLDVLTVVLALSILGMGPAGPGAMTAAIGLGGLLGAAGTAVLIGRRRLAPALLYGMLATGLPVIAVSTSNEVVAAAVLLAASGAGKAFFDVAARTLLQRTVDDDVLARVFGLQEAVLMGGLAIGSATAPVLVRAFGPRGAFVAAGAFLPAAGTLVWRWVHGLDARASVPGAELELLRAVDIFAPLAQPALERLSWDLIPVDERAGSVVIREGDPGDRFYLIVEGWVSITRGPVLLAQRGPGTYVGEVALLRDVARTATVTAVSDVRMLALEREDFLAAVTGSTSSLHAAHSEMARREAENRQIEREVARRTEEDAGLYPSIGEAEPDP